MTDYPVKVIDYTPLFKAIYTVNMNIRQREEHRRWLSFQEAEYAKRKTPSLDAGRPPV
jgi:hypothetical protein